MFGKYYQLIRLLQQKIAPLAIVFNKHQSGTRKNPELDMIKQTKFMVQSTIKKIEKGKIHKTIPRKYNNEKR